MTARHPTPTRTDPPFPYTTPCRSGDVATADDIARLHTALGLDEPLWRQFGLWAGRLLQGDLGTSIFTHVPVTHLLAQRVEPTLSIAVLTMSLSLLIAIPLGVLAA